MSDEGQPLSEVSQWGHIFVFGQISGATSSFFGPLVEEGPFVWVGNPVEAPALRQRARLLAILWP